MFDIVELLMPWLRVLMGSVIVLEHWKFGLFTEGLHKHVHWWSGGHVCCCPLMR